jgi:hypothetical protein
MLFQYLAVTLRFWSKKVVLKAKTPFGPRPARMVRVKIARIKEPLTFVSQAQTLSFGIMEWPQNTETPALKADGNDSFDVHKCPTNRPLARIGSR